MVATKHVPGLWTLAALGVVAASAAIAQDAPAKPADAPISFGAQEQAELWSAVSGGRRRGGVFNGLLTLTANADLGALVGLDGWSLYASVFQIHGRGVTLDKVGAIQVISNIEATRATRLYNLWVARTFLDGRLDVRIGQEGANDEMMVSAQAQLFLNSSFGYPALAATNLPSGGPNYPLATPMARWVYRFSDAFSWAGAVFNGDPAGPGEGDPNLRNRYGVSFRLRDAPLVFNELWFRPEGASAAVLPGLWKIGAWAHTGDFADQRFDATGGRIALTGAAGRRHRGNQAFYAVVDQTIWRRADAPDQALGVWGLVMAAPSRQNLVDLFFEGGVTFRGLIAARPKDTLGLAFAHLRLSDSARGYYADGFAANTGLRPVKSGETIAELTYQMALADKVTLQPSLQHVRNPGASVPSPANRFSQDRLKAATVAGVRLTVNY